ncbi:MAG: hypothetical protein WCJ04_05195 [Actinomycetes bacterium]
MFSIALTLGFLCGCAALAHQAVQKLTEATKEMDRVRFGPLRQVAQDLRETTEAVATKVDERTEG